MSFYTIMSADEEIHCKIFWEGVCCAKHLCVKHNAVTVEWHTGQGKTDDTIPGPGIVVRFPQVGPRTFTISCEQALIEKAIADFYEGKLDIGDVPKEFVQEVLDICRETLRR